MDLIDAYYWVARDLEFRSKQLASQAEQIAQIADRMSEARMIENDKPKRCGHGVVIDPAGGYICVKCLQETSAQGKPADEVKP